MSLSEYLPQPVTVVYRVDAADIGADRDELRAHVSTDTMWNETRTRTVGTDGLDVDTGGVSVQVPAPCGWVPYREFVEAGCPEGSWTCRVGDTVARGDVSADPDGAASSPFSARVSKVRDLTRDSGFLFAGRHGAMRYARVIAIEAV